jgi:hypothetical protein
MIKLQVGFYDSGMSYGMKRRALVSGAKRIGGNVQRK